MHKVEDGIDFLFDRQRQAFLAKKTKLFSEYMQTLTKIGDQNRFVSFTGWPDDLMTKLVTVNQSVQEGGYFFRYNQHGVCINPGQNFFERFTEAGFHLWHIDTVIVTQSENRHFSSLEFIHQFNRELNNALLSHDQEPHVIQYLLHPIVFSSISSKLRPYFRQERESVLCLETFDSVEMCQISDEVQLCYKKENDMLLCRFELQNSTTFGYGALCDPDFFGPCSLVISPYSEDLMITDCKNLQLLLLCEFDIHEGDIRLESVKRIRSHRSDITVLPLDKEIAVDLDHLTLGRTLSEMLIPNASVQVIRKKDFENLMYLANDQTL